MLAMPIFGHAENTASPLLVHNNGAAGGMFAVFSSVLGSLKCFETGQYSGISVEFNNGYYQDQNYGPNWWEYYFEPIHVGNRENGVLECSYEVYKHVITEGFFLSREEGFQLIQKYIHLKPEIQKALDQFVNKKFKDHFVIGVHFRGTDKIVEWRRSSYEEVYKGLKKILSGLSSAQKKKLKIFIATDEQPFIDYMEKKLPRQIIYADNVRSPDPQTPLHHSNQLFNSNYQKGKEALLDCLLLSKCQILLRPNSCFSWASTLFNPTMECIVY